MKTGKFLFLSLALLVAVPQVSVAGIFSRSKEKTAAKERSGLGKVSKGDTIPTFELMEIMVYGRRTYSSRRQQRQYDKLTRNVIKMYPISKEIKAILVETYLYLQNLPDDKAREKHIKAVEDGVWEQYYPVMRQCTLAQGKLLIKLIDRECNQSGYDLINAFAGPFKAHFYQAFAALFGASLKKEYQPEFDDEDQIIEEIIWMIENGTI
ncbi:MAG: DUF4294 domain-containing protein [Bacteroidaceae bacterium]|nr:DUF4294 domain-containing protein [Bacteroidaceae bacterium]